MKKVLEVTESLACGGREALAVNILRGLDLSEYQVDFFTLSSGKQFFTDEVYKYGCRIFSSDTENVNSGTLNFLKKNIKLMLLVRKEKYDVIHIHGDTHLDYVKVFLLKVFTRSRIILHAHGATVLANKSKKILGKFFRMLASEYPEHNIACSEEAKKYMFYPETRVEIIRNPVDLEKLRYSPKIRASVRCKLGVKDNEFLIGHIGRFSEEKNHEFIIEIFRGITKDHHNAKLVLVGEGEKRKEIEKRVEENGLCKIVIFLNATNKLYEIFNAIDILWFPSRKESFGMVALEAQVSGTPVIISDGVPEEISINHNVQRLDFNKTEWIRYTFMLQRISDFKENRFLPFSYKTILERINQMYRADNYEQ